MIEKKWPLDMELYKQHLFNTLSTIFSRPFYLLPTYTPPYHLPFQTPPSLPIHVPCLQTAAVNDLIVDSKLPAFIANDEDANGATTIGKAVRQPLQKVALV